MFLLRNVMFVKQFFLHECVKSIWSKFYDSVSFWTETDTSQRKGRMSDKSPTSPQTPLDPTIQPRRKINFWRG